MASILLAGRPAVVGRAGSGDPRRRLRGRPLVGRDDPHPALRPTRRSAARQGEGTSPAGQVRRRPFEDRPQRIQPVDDEAAQPRVGAVTQERPDRIGFPEPDEGNGGPGLTHGERVLDVLAHHGAMPDGGGHERPVRNVLVTDTDTGRKPWAISFRPCASWAAGSKP